MEVDPKPVSIVLPAYNEKDSIGQTLEELLGSPELQKAEIIVVNDGSIDETGRISRGFENVRVIEHMQKNGYGAAIKTGIKAATREYVCWYDSDGQHNVADLLKLIKKVQGEGCIWGIGVRTKTVHEQLSRKSGKLILKAVAQLAFQKDVSDYNSGLRMFKTSVIRKYLHLLPNGYSASTTSTLIMIERGYLGPRVEISTNPRIGKSNVRPFIDGLRTLVFILRILLLFRSLAVYTICGALMILVGAVYSIYVASVNKLGIPVAGLFALMTGVLMIFMGLIADQLSLLRRERFEDVESSEDGDASHESGGRSK